MPQYLSKRCSKSIETLLSATGARALRAARLVETLREVFVSRIEATLEQHIVLQIQRRLSDYFGALLAGKSCAATARYPGLQLRWNSETDMPDTETLVYWVSCYVVAAVLTAIPTIRHQRTGRSAHALATAVESGEIASVLHEHALQVVGGGHRLLPAMLAQYDIGSSDGTLWRGVYSVWFGRGQPVLILDSLDSLEPIGLREPMLRAALRIARAPSGVRGRSNYRWKTIIAVRDPGLIQAKLAKMASERPVAIRLTQNESQPRETHGVLPPRAML